MVSEQEVSYLVEEKLKQGEDYSEIYEEIKTLKQSQIVFKKQKSEIQILKEQLEKKDRLIKDLQNKNFKLNIQVDSNREDKRTELKQNGNGDMKSLKRIMLILTDSKIPLCFTSIKEECCLGREKTYSCLGFLEKYLLIKRKKDEKGVDVWYKE